MVNSFKQWKYSIQYNLYCSYFINYPVKVGNKIDLLDRQVTTLEASEFAKDNRCFYMETSALDGTGINQAFYTGNSSI